MKAAIYTEYGGPEVLQIKEWPTPVPQDHEVLIKVHAASVNDWDWGLLQGDSVNRLLYGLRKPAKLILGSDVAGTIEAVGKKVTTLKKGDEVYGDLSEKWGGFAEFVCAPENMVAKKSPYMTFQEASSFPQAGMLAVQGLVDAGKIKAGQNLLINGAGGGVGTIGIQIAKSLGVTDITAVDHSSKLELLQSLGATQVIDYTKEDFTKKEQRYDFILDVKTNRSIFDYLRALKPHGMYITVGGDLLRLLQGLLLMPLLKLFSHKKVCIVALKPNKDLKLINEFFESGKLKAVLDEQPFTLNDMPQAMKYFGSARHKGKVVIEIA